MFRQSICIIALLETQITEILANDDSVKGLVLIGSYAQPDVVPDAWSDLDLAVIVDDDSFDRYYPATDWITRFGDLYAFHLSSADYFSVVRAQYTDAWIISPGCAIVFSKMYDLIA